MLIILVEGVSLSASTGPAGPRLERKDQMERKLTQAPKQGTLQALKAQKRACIVPTVAMTPDSVERCVCVCVCDPIRGIVAMVAASCSVRYLRILKVNS